MIKVEAKDLWKFLWFDGHKQGVAHNSAPVSKDLWDYLKSVDLKVIYCARELPPAGEVLRLISETALISVAGFTVFTWHGLKSEVLVVGFKPGQLEIKVSSYGSQVGTG